MIKEIELDGIKMTIMGEYADDKFGKVWRVYLINERRTYVVEGKLVTDQKIIDELDEKYGRPRRGNNLIL